MCIVRRVRTSQKQRSELWVDILEYLLQTCNVFSMAWRFSSDFESQLGLFWSCCFNQKQRKGFYQPVNYPWHDFEVTEKCQFQSMCYEGLRSQWNSAQMNNQHPYQLKKIKILGPILELLKPNYFKKQHSLSSLLLYLRW